MRHITKALNNRFNCLGQYLDWTSQRFDLKRNKELFKKGKYTAPVNLSWGYDNRTCAIRIIGKNQNRRLEFRIPDSNCDIKKATTKFLEMVYKGINSNTKPTPPIYGNAFDNQYNHISKLTSENNLRSPPIKD